MTQIEMSAMHALVQLPKAVERAAETICARIDALSGKPGDPEEGMRRYYFTFGLDHPFSGYQAVVDADSEEHAREAVVKVFGPKWSGINTKSNGNPCLPVIKGHEFGDLDYMLARA